MPERAMGARHRFGRIFRVFFWLMAACLLAKSGFADSQDKRPSLPEEYFFKGGTLHIISSSHQDIAWMNTPGACVEFRDKEVITPALELMARNKDYRFVNENMLNLMEYLDRHPERRDEISRLTREGRLEWGATFVQPYESLLSGEQLVRETYFGRRWVRTNFPGCDAKVYFNPDVPGRSLQMQQILSKAGIPYMMISRYHEGFYRWGSPDGSSVLAYSPGHYSNASAFLNASPAEGSKVLAGKLAEWGGYYQQRGIPPAFPLLNSVDFSKPTDFGGLIRFWNDAHKTPAGPPAPRMEYSSAREFFEAAAERNPRFDSVCGERPNLWLYIHGPTHHWAITAQREAGRLLPAAETFSTIESILSGGYGNYPSGDFGRAWMAAVYPDHGWGGKEGQITDRLFRKKYEYARDEGRRLLLSALEAIASRVRTDPGKGVPVIVFNPLSWKRSAPVIVEAGRKGEAWKVHDFRGGEIAAQMLPSVDSEGPYAGRVEFIASDVPPLGYKTYYLVNGAEAPKGSGAPEPPAATYENEFYRLELAPGGVRSLFDKEMGRELLDTSKFLGFEVFCMQSVGNGAGEFGRVQQPTMEGFDKLSLHRVPWEFDSAESGPVKTVLRFKQSLPDCVLEEKLILYDRLKQIDCEVLILNWDGRPYREFRLALPVNASGGQVAYDVPFGIVEVGRGEISGTGGSAYGNVNYDEECAEIRPREVQNFLYAGDGRLGLTLSTSVAVNDFKDPTPDPAGYPILQPVLLASRRSCHGEGNWYLQEGDHDYRFTLTSHAPGWKNGYQAGIQANNPFLPVVGPTPGGQASLPEEFSFFSVSARNVLVSTIKKCEDDESAVVRLFELEGKDTEVDVRHPFLFQRASRVNIIEEDGTPLKLEPDLVKIRVGHHAIETIKLINRTSGVKGRGPSTRKN